ncbi:hypothetical protein PM3016_1454 [Paenibacillus mucilaginosus 3016]|uniref:Uncharacterized protein n=1 Tax=Paenibacillus mucilaginosus 3016 TaxID=1116391 RepID=H6NGT7_9BACL|nr:hypothetical protein [Paenibacillus mucilaginosus]AFC28379.1 hypothetical protein PM3016_1454 [Paenibacillus mucilaginosus 3016]
MTLDKATLFAYISLAIFILALLLMPKRLNRKEIYTTWFVMACLTLNTDLIFGLILDLYDFIYPDITLSDLILQAALPPAAGILALNFQPQKNSQFLVLSYTRSLLFSFI